MDRIGFPNHAGLAYPLFITRNFHSLKLKKLFFPTNFCGTIISVAIKNVDICGTRTI